MVVFVGICRVVYDDNRVTVRIMHVKVRSGPELPGSDRIPHRMVYDEMVYDEIGAGRQLAGRTELTASARNPAIVPHTYMVDGSVSRWPLTIESSARRAGGNERGLL